MKRFLSFLLGVALFAACVMILVTVGLWVSWQLR